MSIERDPVAEARDAWKQSFEALARVIAPDAVDPEEAIEKAARLVVEHQAMASWIAMETIKQGRRC